MPSPRSRSPVAPGLLATDLDGTLIPLPGVDENCRDLALLADHFANDGPTLLYVTGRHHESVMKAVAENQLPWPDWLICDVGTSIYQHQGGGAFEITGSFLEHQAAIVARLPIDDLREELSSLSGLELQEEEKQGPFKLSYYTDAAQIRDRAGQIRARLAELDAPYHLIASVDPFNGDGLLDLLPEDISKAAALDWWVEYIDAQPEQIVFSGDSGNDLAALTAGYRAIVVANADRSVAREAYETHRQQGWKNRLYLARRQATSGVLEGCRWFGLMEPEATPPRRRGATPITSGKTAFRVWAPHCQRVEVEVVAGEQRTRHALTADDDGYHMGVAAATAGDRYQFDLDQRTVRPDPASARQPDGVHAESEIVDPNRFAWTDQPWQGVAKRDLVIYELHVGTFTEQGTFEAAIERLGELAELGVTAVEVMPVAQTPGKFNWGYDGVQLFAVRNSYGEPDDFKAFVDACHNAGLAVLLDVVYNHLGPEGNYLSEFGPYCSSKHHTPWGDAFNYDGPSSQHVRQFIVDNALYWLDEFHLDGLRLDAVHFMYDDRPETILDELRQEVAHFDASVDRPIHLIAEANVYDPELLASRPERPAYDAIWCDCLMHSIYAHTLPDLQLTNRLYRGGHELAEVLSEGRLFAGRKQQRVAADADAQGESRRSIDAVVESFVVALQTHDAVGNHPQGKRFHQLTSPAAQRAAATLTLLYPGIPLIFMGEEIAADSPFPFFADFEDPRLRRAVDRGRAKEFPQHTWGEIGRPSDWETFAGAMLTEDVPSDDEMFQWYRSLLALRREGIEAGWLHAERMTTDYDADREIYTLTFTGDDSQIIALVRLSRVDEADRQPVAAEPPGELLLSSEADAELSDGYVHLSANHAVVGRRNLHEG